MVGISDRSSSMKKFVAVLVLALIYTLGAAASSNVHPERDCCSPPECVPGQLC
jgi:hypothetical protein